MMRRTTALLVLLVTMASGVVGCTAADRGSPATSVASGTTKGLSYAVYGEYAVSPSKVMQPDLNRRVFNKVEAQAGTDIALNPDGSITLQPGTYKITGYSITSMQQTFAPPEPKNNSNYPGYALVYPVADETGGEELLKHAIGIGSPQTALDGTPSDFDLVYTTNAATSIAVGHQSGAKLNDEVYLTVYDVAGIPSDYHVFARISITKL